MRKSGLMIMLAFFLASCQSSQKQTYSTYFNYCMKQPYATEIDCTSAVFSYCADHGCKE